MPRPIKFPDNINEINRDFILKKYSKDEILEKIEPYVDEDMKYDMYRGDCVRMSYLIDYFNIDSLEELQYVKVAHDDIDEVVTFYFRCQKELSKEERLERGIDKLIIEERRKLREKQIKEESERNEYQQYLRLKEKFEEH